MSSNQNFAFSPPTPTEPLRLYKHSHKVSIQEGSPHESHNAYVQEAPNLNPKQYPPRVSSIRNPYMENPQTHHDSDPKTSSPRESWTSSFSSGWRSSYNTETNSSSHLNSDSAATASSSRKTFYLPDSPEGVMGNFIPMDSTNMARPQVNSHGGKYHNV